MKKYFLPVLLLSLMLNATGMQSAKAASLENSDISESLFELNTVLESIKETLNNFAAPSAEGEGSVLGASTVYTSQKATSAFRLGYNNNYSYLVQTFRVNADSNLSSVSLALARRGLPTAPIQLIISEPYRLGEVVNQTFLPQDLPTTYLKPKWVDVSIEKPALLKAGKEYLLWLKYSDYNLRGNNPNYYFWSVNTSNPYKDGSILTPFKSYPKYDFLAGFNFSGAQPIAVTSPSGGEKWLGSPKTTDTLSGNEIYTQYIKWTGAPDDFRSIYEGRVKAFLEKYENGKFITVGRIPPFAAGSIAWVVGVVSKENCAEINGVDADGCFNSENIFVAPSGRYYVRIIDTETNIWSRSNEFSIVGETSEAVKITSGIQPQATLAPRNSVVPFTVIKVSTSKEVSLGEMTVERTGLSSDGGFKEIVLIANSGVDKNNINRIIAAGTIDPVTHRARLLPINAPKINGEAQFTVAGVMNDNLSKYAGEVAYLSVTGATFSSGAVESIYFPITGTAQTLNDSLTIGSAKITSDTTPWVLSASSVEELLLTKAIIKFAGDSITVGGAKYACEPFSYNLTISACNFGNGIIISKGTGVAITPASSDARLLAMREFEMSGKTYGYRIIPGQVFAGTGSALAVRPSKLFSAQNVISGAMNAKLGSFDLDASNSTGEVKINTVKVRLTTSSNLNPNQLNSLQLYDGDTPIVWGSNTVNPAGTQDSDDIFLTFNLNQPLSIKAGTTKTIDVRGNVGTGTQNGDNLRFDFENIADGDWNVIDAASGNEIVEDLDTATFGSIITIVTSGKVSEQIDLTSPVSKNIPAGSASVEVLRLRLSALDEDVKITNLNVAIDSPGDFSAVSLYDGSVLVGQKTFPSSNLVQIYLSEPFVVPSNNSKVISVRVDVLPQAGVGHIFSVWTTTDPGKGVGLVSGNEIKISLTGNVTSGSQMKIASAGGELSGGGGGGPVNTTDLVSNWKFDGGTGDSAGTNNGTLMNGAKIIDDGKVGKAVFFDGSDDHVSIPNAASLMLDKYTISFWFRPVGNINEYDSYSHVFLGKGSNNTLGTANRDGRFEIRGPLPRAYSSSANWISGTWYFATLSFDGSLHRLYINGKEEGSAAGSYSLLANDNKLTIGGDPQLFSWFNGAIDEVKIHNRALSAAEISALYMSSAATALENKSSTGSNQVASLISGLEKVTSSILGFIKNLSR
ncbi:LamG domain-containing protein [Candidatus Giovannonibacteria bacterium]|nr:LamG domain-containing protein [Candidatus Giovannonibacteria bacterium]